VVLLFVIDPISILAHPHSTTVGKLWKSLVVIHSQQTQLKATWPAFQPLYENLVLAKRPTYNSIKPLHGFDTLIDDSMKAIFIFLVMNITTYITD
jgi:hypothetical protein